MAKFTFRKEPRETGLRAVGNPYPATVIKRAGKEVGRISPPNWQRDNRQWRVGLMVKDANVENAGWRWAFFAIQFDAEPEVRAWLLAHQAKIEANYELREEDDT